MVRRLKQEQQSKGKRTGKPKDTKAKMQGQLCASIIMRNANELEIIFNSLVSHLLSWSFQLIRFAIFKYLCALCFHYLFDSRNLCLHPEIEIRNWNRIGRTFFGQLQPLGKLRVPYQAIDKAVNVFQERRISCLKEWLVCKR